MTAVAEWASRILKGKVNRVDRVGAVLVSVLLAAGLTTCGNGSTAAGPPSSPSSAPTSPTSTPMAWWSTYSSKMWGYSFKFPPEWTDLGDLGAGKTEEYLSNVPVGSPEGLDSNGIFLAISIHQFSGRACAQHGLANATVDRQDAIDVDGLSATLYILSGQLPYMELNLEKDTYCYMFSFVFGSRSARDANESTAQMILGQTFKFGQPTAPAP
ncbi:MAG: hypothetical protein E6I98_08840 [Chloroflexi bacterium]|nr:MAG: hypothetical protein E6I98_08840 [Chloroflexota bacterium]